MFFRADNSHLVVKNCVQHFVHDLTLPPCARSTKPSRHSTPTAPSFMQRNEIYCSFKLRSLPLSLSQYYHFKSIKRSAKRGNFFNQPTRVACYLPCCELSAVFLNVYIDFGLLHIFCSAELFFFRCAT